MAEHVDLRAQEQEAQRDLDTIEQRYGDTRLGAHNFDVVKNPKVRVHLDDARHFLLTTDEKFDAITSDPLDPWVKGAAMLYTREFFDLVKSRLNPGGAVTLFVQLYESNTEAVKSEIATFMEAFPNGIVWGNTQEGRGYDLVLLGQLEPKRIDVDAIEQRLRLPEYAQVRYSLSQIGMNSAVDLFSTYAGTATELVIRSRAYSVTRTSACLTDSRWRASRWIIGTDSGRASAPRISSRS